MNWNERSAIVTGGAGGLGASHRPPADRAGHAGGGVRPGPRGRDQALVDELGSGAAVGGDINSDADVNAALDAAAGLAPLAVVVNVAGGGAGGRTLSRDGEPMDIEAFRFTVELNTVGTFNVTRLAAARMATNEPDEYGQRGVVVNTASIAGYEGQTGQVAYGASKAAVLGMSLPLARDLAPVGHPGLRHRPGHHGDPAHAERPRGPEGEAGGEHRLPQAHGPARRVRPCWWRASSPTPTSTGRTSGWTGPSASRPSSPARAAAAPIGGRPVRGWRPTPCGR